jgi:hypothetical protein
MTTCLTILKYKLILWIARPRFHSIGTSSVENENSLGGLPPVSRGGTYLSNCLKKLDGVKIGTVYTKWGNLNENLLNRVIAVKIIELGGKNWNLL